MIGKTLAHYKIIDAIGRGGMGEVYRATDTKLGRDVAIKILPHEFSEDPERRARFEREARSLATLQHPNVASVYGFEEVDGVRFLVMELVEGEDLSKHIARGLSVEDAIAIASQIALGLEAAHEKGIVHRDLKPANVQISSDGTVKLLDFGLARAWDDEGAAADPLNSPTITSANMTALGVIMGTAAYMSPEQARGKNVDRQADVWAFGCVFYELLTGKVAYPGETITDTLAAIIHKEPDWSALPAHTPNHLRRLMELCMRKSPQERLRDVRDIRLLMAAPTAAEQQAALGNASASRRTVAGIAWPVLAILLALALAANQWRHRSPALDTSPAPAAASRIIGMEQLTDRAGEERDPGLSPDARQMLFATRDGGDFDIFLQRVGGENPVNLTADFDSEDDQPSFSPDGERIAFSSTREGGGVFVMGATGETPLRVADFGYDPAWSPDGRSLVVTEEHVNNPYGRNGLANLWIINIETRDKRRLNAIDATGPSWSPHGQRIAFWTHLETVKGQRDIYTIGIDGSDPKAVTLDAATDWDPVWSPDGRWLYWLSDRGGSPDLWRQRIEESTGETMGSPQPVTAGMTRLMQLDIAANGQMALMSEDSNSELLSIPFDESTRQVTGKPTTLLASSNRLSQVDASEDGEWLVYATTAPAENLYVMRRDGSARRRIVATADRNRGPEFMPGSNWIIYYSNRSGTYQIWAIRRDGSNLKQLTGNPQQGITVPGVTLDGRIFSSFDVPQTMFGELKLPEGGIDVVEAPLEMQLVADVADFQMSSVSPGGLWIEGFRLSSDGRAVYSPQTGEVRAMMMEGVPMMTDFEPEWLDDRRVVLWLARRNTAVVWDVELQRATPLENLPGPANYILLRGQNTLIANTAKSNSEIWLITLQDDTPGSRDIIQ